MSSSTVPRWTICAPTRRVLQAECRQAPCWQLLLIPRAAEVVAR